LPATNSNGTSAVDRRDCALAEAAAVTNASATNSSNIVVPLTSCLFMVSPFLRASRVFLNFVIATLARPIATVVPRRSVLELAQKCQ